MVEVPLVGGYGDKVWLVIDVWTRGRNPAPPPVIAGANQLRHALKEVAFTRDDTAVMGQKSKCKQKVCACE